MRVIFLEDSEANTLGHIMAEYALRYNGMLVPSEVAQIIIKLKTIEEVKNEKQDSKK